MSRVPRTLALGCALAAIAAGVAARTWLVAVWRPIYRPGVEHEEGYYEAGVSLLSCGTLSQAPDTRPTAFRAPLFPSLIALSEAPYSAPRPEHERWALLVLSLLGLALTFGLGRSLISPAAGLAAAAFAAADWRLVEAAPSLNVHAFYGLLLLCVAAAAAAWGRSGRRLWAFAFGLAGGAALLCRSAHYPLPLLFAALALAWARDRREAAGWIGAFAGGMALALLPAVLRNAAQFHEFLPFDYKGAYILLRGTAGPFDITTVEQALEVADRLSPGFSARGLAGHALYEALIRLALRNMAAHPFSFAWYCLQRLFMFWRGLWPWLGATAVLLWRRRTDRGVWAVAAVGLSLSGYAIAGGAAEYRVTAMPVLELLAGLAVGELLSPGARGPRPGRWAAAATAVPAALWLMMGLLLAREVRSTRAGADASFCDGRATQMLLLGYRQAPGPDRDWARQAYVHSSARDIRGRIEARDYAGALDLARASLRVAPGDSELIRLRTVANAGPSPLPAGRPDLPPGPLPSAKAVEGLKAQAVRLYRAGDAAGALTLLRFRRKEARYGSPTAEAEVLAAMAVLEWGQGGRPRALADFRSALRLSAARACGGGLDALDRSRAPRPFIELCAERWPADPRWLLDRGVAAYLDGDAARAAADLRRALELKPGFLEAALSLSTALRGLGRPQEAARALSAALEAAGSGGDPELRRRAQEELQALGAPRASRL